MFNRSQILFEDNHLMVVNKPAGALVQSDAEGESGLEDEIKEFIKVRDDKPGNVFLGVVHRIDRPVSGVVLFAKSKKALVRLNEILKNQEFKKIYWAVTDARPEEMEGTLTDHIERDAKSNKSRCVSKQTANSKVAKLNYKVIAGSDRYTMLEVQLLTGRHHQIRCQLARMGCAIKGDLKYGAPRSNKDGSISLHARSLEFVHPVRKETIKITAPTPQEDNLWRFFENSQR